MTALALLVALPIALLAWLLISAVRKSRRTGSGAPVVRLAYVVAAIWAIGCAIGAIIAVISALMSPELSITVPVREFWPELPSGITTDGPTATLMSGGFTELNGQVEGLDVPTRILWAISQVLWALVPGSIAALIAIACSHLLKGRAFTEVLARLAMTTAVIVAVGGFAAQILGDIAGSLAATQLLEISSASWTGDFPGVEDPLEAWMPMQGFNLTLAFWPLAAGLGLAALAAMFRFGDRLQRDADGLV